MSNSQMVGIRMLCLALGWVFGALLFGTEATWLFGIQSFIWCGFAGGTIGMLLTTKQKCLGGIHMMKDLFKVVIDLRKDAGWEY